LVASTKTWKVVVLHYGLILYHIPECLKNGTLLEPSGPGALDGQRLKTKFLTSIKEGSSLSSELSSESTNLRITFLSV